MPTTEDGKLLEVFQKYCSFGTRSNGPPSASGDGSRRASITAPQMEGSKFAKLAREAGLLDSHVITPTEIDILFSRVKDKTERKISFAQFRTALRLIAEKKYHQNHQNHQPEQEQSSTDAKSGIAETEERILVAVRELDGPQLAEGTTLPEKSPMLDRLMEGPATYISKSPKDDARAWKDDLRRSPASPATRRSTSASGSIGNSPLAAQRRPPVRPQGVEEEREEEKIQA